MALKTDKLQKPGNVKEFLILQQTSAKSQGFLKWLKDEWVRRGVGGGSLCAKWHLVS